MRKSAISVMVSLFCLASPLMGTAHAAADPASRSTPGAPAKLDMLMAKTGAPETCKPGANGECTTCASNTPCALFTSARERFMPMFVLGRLVTQYKRANGLAVVDYSGAPTP
jgi:hypothetical protein